MESILGNMLAMGFGLVFLLPFIAIIIEKLERKKQKRKNFKKS